MSKTARTYSEEEIQAKIDEAINGDFYWNVDDFPNKTNVIGGATKQWSAGYDIVYAPDARLCGTAAAVEAAFITYKIDEDSRTLYTDAKSEGFQEELEAYKERRKNPTLADDEAFEKLKDQIKKKQKEDVNLASMIKTLLPGRAVNVSEIANKKFSTINVASAHILSNLICVPGLAIASKTEEAYITAVRSIYDGERADLFIAAWQAIKAVRDNVRPPKAPSKGAANGKKTPAKATSSKEVAKETPSKEVANGKKTAPPASSAAEKKSAPPAASKKAPAAAKKVAAKK